METPMQIIRGLVVSRIMIILTNCSIRSLAINTAKKIISVKLTLRFQIFI